MGMRTIVCMWLAIVGLFISGTVWGVAAARSDKAQPVVHTTPSYEQIKTAAENGDADAQYALGYMLYYGKSGAPKDPGLAKVWIGKAAAQKQPQAVKAMALMHAKIDEQAAEKTDSMIAQRQPKEAKEDSSLGGNASYTLQLLGAFKQEEIKKLARAYHLSQAKIYQTTFKDKEWYVLIYGQYKTRAQALSAAKRLEEEWALKPWVKPLASIKHYKLVARSMDK